MTDAFPRCDVGAADRLAIVAGSLQLLGTVAIALAWLIPNHYPPWTSFYNESAMAVGLALVSVGTLLGRQSIGMPALAMVALVGAAIPWFQWCFGVLRFSGDAWIATLYALGFATAIATGYRWSHVDARQLGAALSCAALAAALISCALAAVQVFQVSVVGMWIGEIVDGTRASANLAQSNNLATLIAFGAVGLFTLREQRRISDAFSTAMLVVLIAGLSLTQSRMGLFFGPVILLGGWMAKRRGIPLRTSPGTLFASTACSWLLMCAEPHLVEASLLASHQSVAARGVQSLRFTVWPMLADGLSLHPWRGWGWLQVGAAQFSVADHYPPVGEFWLQAHNLFFELVIWCGYPLGVVLGVAIVWWFADRLLRVSTPESVAGMFVAAVGGVHAMSEFPYQYAYFLLPAGLWMGLVERDIGSRSVGTNRWHQALIITSAVLLLAIWRDYAVVEEDFRDARFENFRVGANHSPEPARDAPFLSGLTEFLRLTRLTPRAGMSEEELERMRAVAERYPYAAVLLRYASALSLNGLPDEARVVFSKILVLHGADIYMKVKGNLHEAATAGPPSLAQLEHDVP